MVKCTGTITHVKVAHLHQDQYAIIPFNASSVDFLFFDGNEGENQSPSALGIDNSLKLTTNYQLHYHTLLQTKPQKSEQTKPQKSCSI